MPADTKIKIKQTLINKTQQEKNIILQQRISTMKQNKSFNSSTPEENYYNYLLTKYKKDDIIRQYATDKRYPFVCDFYIPKLDLFIELNHFKSHNGHLFNQNNADDHKELQLLQEKAKTSKFYEKMIQVWTVTDQLKFETAIKK